MAALFDVDGWPSKSINQEIAEPLFRTLQILLRIHGTQEIIRGNLTVERAYQPFKSLIADRWINLVLFHSFIVPGNLGDRAVLPVPDVIILAKKCA